MFARRLPAEKGLIGSRGWRAVRYGWVVGLSVALVPAVAVAETETARVGDGGFRLSFLEGSPVGRWRHFDLGRPAPGRTVEALEALFARLDYRLDRVRERGVVPRLLVRRMPDGLSRMHETQRRKALFIRIALPLILTTNEAILRDRRRIERLRAAQVRDGFLPVGQERWLWQVFAAYKVKPGDFAELLSRVDIVPPSLAVAQAAEETGWGTSRFVRRGNALFGQRTYRSAHGMVPRRMPPGDRFRVRRFSQLLAAVASYVSNLNTHPAYAAFRARRSEMRGAGRLLDATALAGGLEAYSARRGAYVRTVRAIIRTNGLADLDRLELESGLPQFAGGPPTGTQRLAN